MSSGGSITKTTLIDTESGQAINSNSNSGGRSEDTLKSIFQRLESSEKSLAAAGVLTSGGRIASSANADNLSDAEVRFLVMLYVYFFMYFLYFSEVIYLNSSSTMSMIVVG